MDNEATGPLRDSHAIDEAALAGWMDGNVEGFAGPLILSRFAGGQSNPTYRLKTPLRDYVLRKKPPGKLLKGAHAVEREARAMAALGEAGFPVPRIFGLCTDEQVIGTPFFVMEMMAGRIFRDARLPEVPREQRPAIYDATNAAIARLHAFDPAAIGMGDYGREGGYIERQIALWTRQYLADEQAGRDPAMDALAEWLPANVPPGGSTRIIHGDFRCDNLVFDAAEPRLLAVLDWELSTLGDPLSDFAYHAIMYRLPPDFIAGLAGQDLAALNIPDEDAYVAAYCRRMGIDRIAHWDFYIAFNLFRLAAIFHGIKGRLIRGNASSAEADQQVRKLPVVAALALETAHKSAAHG